MPLSPSIITSRTSLAVGPTSAMRLEPRRSTFWRTRSAPVRVLPNPRPASTSQVRQSPSGASCFGRAQNSQT